ncbi:MAG: hypothetical protein Q9162_003711 [Coniocarpon cinnabarinum]
MPAQKLRKIAIVGSRSVGSSEVDTLSRAGKSSLTVQYVDGHFVESYYPTIENTFSKIIKYKGQDFATEIIDTAGQVFDPPLSLSPPAPDAQAPTIPALKPSEAGQTPESQNADVKPTLKDEYTLLNSKHFIGIHGYMIVYSVQSKQSFEMVRVIREKILNHLGVDWVPMMIVGNKSDLRQEQRQVFPDDGKKLAQEFDCAFSEASARYNENVGKSFEGMIGQIEKTNDPNEPTGGGKCAVM